MVTMYMNIPFTRSLQVKSATRFVEPSLSLWLCLKSYTHCNERDIFILLIYYTGRIYHIDTLVVM